LFPACGRRRAVRRLAPCWQAASSGSGRPGIEPCARSRWFLNDVEVQGPGHRDGRLGERTIVVRITEVFSNGRTDRDAVDGEVLYA